jgi:hypothetical protein
MQLGVTSIYVAFILDPLRSEGLNRTDIRVQYNKEKEK